MWLVAVDTLGWFATEVRGLTKVLTVEELSHGSGVFKLLPFDNTMAEFMNLEHFAYVCVREKGDYKYWVFSYESMCDSVFVS
jgi:hypothetical protein